MTDPSIARLFQALSDPQRMAIVERLARGPATVSELRDPAGVGLPAVLKQLRVLEEGGIVTSRKTGRTRTYRIRGDAFAPVETWVDARKSDINDAIDRLSRLMAATPEDKDH